jgi:catechol 2,3-dioxygenase-like lactoylglutathione lyase family enzyme
MYLDHLVLVTADVPRLCAFWERVLRAQVVDLEAWRQGRKEYPHLVLGDWKINVHDIDASPRPAAAQRVPGSADLCLAWDGPIERAVAFLADRDVGLELGPVAQLGARGWAESVYFRDPDRNLLEFISYDAD